MTKKKERQLQKLRKIHVWPSISMFLGSVFLSMLTLTVILASYLSLGAEDQTTQAIRETDNITTLVSDMTESGRTAEEALRYLESGRYGKDAVYILDKDGNTIAGYGEPTFIYEKSTSDKAEDLVSIYPDEKLGANIVINKQKGNISYTAVNIEFFREAFAGAETLGSGDEYGDIDWLNEQIVKEPFWMRHKTLPDGDQLLVKHYITATRKDILYSFIIGAIAASLMMIPSISLFIHSLRNIAYQKKMQKMLFIDSVTGGNNWYYFKTNAEKILKKLSNANKFYAVIDLTLMKYRNYCICNGAQAGAS